MGKATKLKRVLGIFLVALTLCALLAPAVSMADDGDWTQFQRNELNSGRTSDSAPTSSPSVEWSVFTHYRSTHGIDVTPIVANGKIFVIDVDGYAWAFDCDTGSEIWSTELEDDNRFSLATPAYGEGKVFFATDGGYIYALDESTGSILWGGRITEGINQEAELNTQIVYAEGKIYIGSWEGKYHCLDAAGDGTDPKIDWTYDIAGKRYDWYSGAAVIGDFLLFGDTDSVLVSVNKATGVLVDQVDLGAVYGITAGSIRSAVSANDSQDRIYLTSKNGYIFTVGFDAAAGEFDTSDGWLASIDNYCTSTPVFYDGKVYVCSGGSFFGQEGGLYCFDESTGSQDWFHDLNGAYGSQSSPALSIQNGRPYIYLMTGATNGTACCFDGDGNMLWEYIPDHPEFILQGVAIAGGRVFFGNDAGWLYALTAYPDWDVNEDGVIDIADVSLIGGHWGETGDPGWIREDVNNDGVVNIADVTVIGGHWGE